MGLGVGLEICFSSIQLSAWTARSMTDFLWTSPAAVECQPSNMGKKTYFVSQEYLEVNRSEILLQKKHSSAELSSRFGTVEH